MPQRKKARVGARAFLSFWWWHAGQARFRKAIPATSKADPNKAAPKGKGVAARLPPFGCGLNCDCCGETIADTTGGFADAATGAALPPLFAPVVRVNVFVRWLWPQPDPPDKAPKLQDENAHGFGSDTADAVGADIINVADMIAHASTVRVFIVLFPLRYHPRSVRS